MQFDYEVMKLSDRIEVAAYIQWQDWHLRIMRIGFSFFRRDISLGIYFRDGKDD